MLFALPKAGDQQFNYRAQEIMSIFKSRIIQSQFLLYTIFLCLLAGIIPATAQQAGSIAQQQSRTGAMSPHPGVPPLTAGTKKELRRREDSLRHFADNIVLNDTPAVRLRSDSQFIRMLVRALKAKNSFFYPFDSLATISRLYSPDSSFRIFTWQFKKDDLFYLQEGAIQMNQPDGSLKLFPLFDVSMFTAKPTDSIRSRKNWIGAIYYRIIQKVYNGQNYYTLLGFDDYSETSNKKWMEVLTFSPEGEPVFGGPYISFEEDSVRKPLQYRFNIEYRKDASTRFNYDPEMDMIIFDHLIPENGDTVKKDTYVPDGDFEGFKWKDGRWVHVDKVFNFKLKDGEAPQEQPIRDENGNVDEKKLLEQSIRNQQKMNKDKAKPAPKKSGG